MARRRTEEDLREALLDACERCVARGVGEVTARAVMAEAGVSTGTLYHYFATLDDLLFAIAARGAGRQLAEFGDPSSVDVLSILRSLFDPDRRDTVLPWLRQRAATSHTLRVSLQRYDEAVGDLYAARLRAEGYGTTVDVDVDVDVEAAVEVVRALAEGFQLRVSSGTLGVGPDRFVAMVIDLVTAAWLDRREVR